MKIKVEALTEDSFRAYGKVLGRPDENLPDITDAISNVWLGVSGLMDIGHRGGQSVTYLEIHSRPERYDTIERHLTSAEAFIPLRGESVLVVGPAGEENPSADSLRAFYLDGSCGVLFPRGTWHAVPYALSDAVTFLVLVDDVSIRNGDIDKRTVEDMAFDLSGITDTDPDQAFALAT